MGSTIRSRILIVEDNPDHAEMIRMALLDLIPSDKIYTVSHGEEAINYLYHQVEYEDKRKSPRPSLILLDLKLPRMDGFEVLRQIKSDEHLRSIPVILLTTSADMCEIIRGYQYGANSYVTKPLKYDEFINRIRHIHYYWSQTNTLPLLENNGYTV